MEFAPAILFGSASAGAVWYARRKWNHLQQEMAHDFYVAAHVLFEDGTFEARLLAEDNGTIIAVNEAAADLFKWRASDLAGHTIQKLLFLAESGTTLEALAERYKQQQELYRACLEMEGQRKDGTVFPMELRFSDIRLGKDMFILITARDLTQARLYKQWERDVELAGGTLQYVGYPILVVDSGGAILKHNLAFEEFSGYSGDEIRAARYWDLLLDADHRTSAGTRVSELLTSGITVSEDASWRLKSGVESGVRLVMRRLEAAASGTSVAVIAALPLYAAPPLATSTLPSYEADDIEEEELLAPPEPHFLSETPAAMDQPAAAAALEPEPAVEIEKPAPAFALEEPLAEPEPPAWLFEPAAPAETADAEAPVVDLPVVETPVVEMPVAAEESPLALNSLDEYPPAEVMQPGPVPVESRPAAEPASPVDAGEALPPLHAFEPASFLIPTMDRPVPAGRETRNRISAEEAARVDADYRALTAEFAIPERHDAAFREMNLNEKIRERKPGLARLLGSRIRFSTTLDLGLDSVLGDGSLLDELCLTLAWIGRHGMASGGKVSLSTGSVTLERGEARQLAGLRGGSYGVLSFRFQPTDADAEIHALLFTPFHESSAGATLQATIPALHSLLRANGANLVVESGTDETVSVKVYLPMARQNARPGRASIHD